MSTLAELRARVRSQTNTTSDELPDSDVDEWLQEGFDRTISLATLWPSYQHTWTVSMPAGQAYFDLPTHPTDTYEVNESGLLMVSDLSGTSKARLDQVAIEWAEEHYPQTATVVSVCNFYALWGRRAYLYPRPSYDDSRDYELIGYRSPNDWIAEGASAEADCDSRLHRPIAHYATALAYAQQEDEVLERTYMERWEKDVAVAMSAIFDTPTHRPLTMGPRFVTPIGPVNR